MSPHREQLRRHIDALLGRMILTVRSNIGDMEPLADLTMAQLRTLLLLHGRGPLRMSDLASRLGVGLPTTTSLVGKLEEKGLASREHDRQDRRVVFCSASERGRQEAERIWRVKRERLVQITDALSERELDLVAQALEAVLRAAERCHAEAPAAPLVGVAAPRDGGAAVPPPEEPPMQPGED